MTKQIAAATARLRLRELFIGYLRNPSAFIKSLPEPFKQRISVRLGEWCTATANGWFSVRTRQLIEDKRAVVCETAILAQGVGGFDASLDMCRAFTTLGSGTIPFPRVLFPEAACCFNYEIKQGILDRVGERRDGPHVEDLALVLAEGWKNKQGAPLVGPRDPSRTQTSQSLFSPFRAATLKASVSVG